MNEDYDPAFVAVILATDAEIAEASFNNIEELLNWLNGDEINASHVDAPRC